MFAYLISMIISFSSSSEIVYKEKTGDIITINKCLIINENNKYNIKFKSLINNNEQYNMNFETDQFYSTLKWEFINKTTNIKAFRQNNYIFLSGIFNGKKIEKKYQINVSPWKQIFPLDLGKTINLNGEKINFWSISPKNLDISEFSAKIVDCTSIIIDNKKIESYHCLISLKGILSIFWSADSWYRKTDMTFVKYLGVNGPIGTPATKIELFEN